MPESLRNRLGRFLPRSAMAAEAVEAPEGADVEVVEDDFALPATPKAIAAELADVRKLLVEARARREDLLLAGALAELEVLDDEIKRLETAAESFEVRHVAAYETQAELAYGRRVAAWRAMQPRLEAARAARDKAAFELWQAVDRAADVEAEAGRIGIALDNAEITPLEAPLTRYLWQRWAEAHARRIGLMPQRAA